uniref:putative tripartite motif-containing protein 75 n=1 Tax=Jaculus jaculus TaxID=51337 RepID=UPI001E1B2335|nr:putative tripartite motif-containing protein 75 [Jaculus jaculus]
MALEKALANLQAESKCQICLGEMTDPVTIECGHNFCSTCITQSWADLEGRFPCPVCRYQCQKSPLTGNLQLRRILARARQLHGQLSKTQEEKPQCEKHGRALTLFCEQDLELLCALCPWLPAHRGHPVRLIEEAASQHRARLHGYMQALNRQVAELQDALAAQARRQAQLQETMESERTKLCSECKQLKQLVDREQQAVLSRLGREEREMVQKLRGCTRRFAQHVSAMEALLAEASEKSVTPDVELLMGVGSLFRRCEDVQPPAFYLFKFTRHGYCLPPRFSTLQAIRQKFREAITLDPETAAPPLLVSGDRKSVRCCLKRGRGGPGSPARPERCAAAAAAAAVLGAQSFGAGRHYWEVRVGDKAEWAVGLCKDPAGDGDGRPSRRWVLGRRGGAYVAEHTVSVALELAEKPSRIGIYLDYELGVIFFYNLSDRTHIHSFRDKFSEALRPYFHVGEDSKPLSFQ